MRRFAAKTVGIISGIAFVVFFFMPFHTGTEFILCTGSLVVALAGALIAGSLDDEKTGYWPTKPKP